MIRVILVEDELLVRLGMKMCLEEHADELEVVETFATAQEALDFFAHHTADVLITDIRLPGMSGLEMLDLLGNQHDDMCKIVLSCYDNFSYAREAYEKGVDRYLLKHELEEEDLANIVIELWNEAKTDRLSSGKKDSQVKQNTSGIGVVVGVHFLDGANTDGNLDINMIGELLVQTDQRGYIKRYRYRNERELLCYLLYPQNWELAQIKETVQRQFSESCELLGNYINQSILWVASSLFLQSGEPDDRERRKSAEKQVQKVMATSFYRTDSQLLWAEKAESFEQTCPPLDFPLAELLSQKSDDSFAIYIQQYFRECEQKNIHPDAVRVQVAAFLYELGAHLQKNYGCRLEEVYQIDGYPPNHLGIQRIACSRRLCRWLQTLVDQLCDYVEKLRSKQSVIAGVLEFLQQNYADEITLGSLAEKFCISPSYLSFLFREKTGVTFTCYLNQIRIQQAKILLESSDESIESIARTVGFRNPNYFFRLFKKLVGCTAGEYRKLERGNISKNIE